MYNCLIKLGSESLSRQTKAQPQQWLIHKVFKEIARSILGYLFSTPDYHISELPFRKSFFLINLCLINSIPLSLSSFLIESCASRAKAKFYFILPLHRTSLLTNSETLYLMTFSFPFRIPVNKFLSFWLIYKCPQLNEMKHTFLKLTTVAPLKRMSFLEGIRKVSIVDSWATWGLGAPTLDIVKNPHITSYTNNK